MVRSILAVINPVSGYSRSRELPAELRRRLRREGLSAEFYVTRGPTDAYEYTLRHGREFDLVLAAGGDGTVRDVISATAALGVPLTVLPSGTENLFAKEMGISPVLDRVLETIKWGRRIKLDIGKVNQRRFIMLAGIGFDAQVLVHLNSFRTGNITHFTYFWPVWRTFWEYEFPRFHIEADGDVLAEDEPGLVIISNMSRYAVGLRICPQARCDDGLLDLCFYRCRDQMHLLAHAWRTLRRRHLGQPDVVYRQARCIRVRSRSPVPLQADGDPLGVLPAEFTVLPGAAIVQAPPA